jgi:drug/metabolite transporter (DMT)-like permease
VAVVLALVASVFFAGSYVLQYHEAHQAPEKFFLSPRLLLVLMSHPVWLAGIGAMIVGNLLQAAALGRGSLAVVEPILTTSLLFALPMAAAWRRERLAARDWLGAIAVSGGIIMLLLFGQPGAGASTTNSLSWALTTLSTWGLSSVLVAAAQRTSGTARAALVAGAAGVLFGLQDALTRNCLAIFSANGLHGLLSSWQPYVLLVSGIYGLVLAQSSYEAGTLQMSLPSMTVAEPVIGILIGVLALDEPLRTTALHVTGEAVGGVVMILGTYILARSPLVVGRHQHELAKRRRAESTAAKKAARADRADGARVRREG